MSHNSHDRVFRNPRTGKGKLYKRSDYPDLWDMWKSAEDDGYDTRDPKLTGTISRSDVIAWSVDSYRAHFGQDAEILNYSEE